MEQDKSHSTTEAFQRKDRFIHLPSSTAHMHQPNPAGPNPPWSPERHK